MNSGLRVHLQAFGYETDYVPVEVEIFDSAFRSVEKRWLKAKESLEFPLKPGIYGVRASLPSGVMFDKAVPVSEGEMKDCTMPLHEASPHEGHEWAYFTKIGEAPGSVQLSDRLYEAVWIRLWQLQTDGDWRVAPLPIHDNNEISWNEDGVSYRFQAPTANFYALQVGGPRIPWKIVGLPSSYDVMVLVRPSSGPVRRVHPLDVVVSSNDFELETLLALMQRGDTSSASNLIAESHLAERLLHNKWENTAAAAVGGYFLLRVNDMERLHNWVNNLANWFQWMADGPVIHAWQLIAEVRNDPNQEGVRLEQARGRLLEAVRRGVPLYTEGLRLLRDGLLLFDQRAKGDDGEIRAALARVGEFVAAADWSAITTTFTGTRPDKPSTKSPRGKPRGSDPLIYVFDVPLREAIRRGMLKAGEEIIAQLSSGPVHIQVSERGKLELPDGRTFNSVGALQKALTGNSSGAYWSWQVGQIPLGYKVMSLRIQ